MYAARSDAKNAARYATSSGLPKRRIGFWSRNSLRRCAGIAWVTSVSITPGAIQFAVMPRRPYSAAIDLVNAAMPPLLPAYADIAASPVAPAIDVILIIRPYLLRNIWGRASLQRLYGTIMFT